MAESRPERVLFVHAHPDDESISTGATIATLVRRGAQVTVLTCTRGERGEVIPPELAPLASDGSALAAHREGELRDALTALGVTDGRYLGAEDARWPGRPPRRYLDSGMVWGPGGAEAPAVLDPASLSAADFGEVAADIAAVIERVRPDAVVTYDELGGYGHPDHVRAHEATRRAAEVLDVPFFVIVPPDSTGKRSISIGGRDVLESKRSALRAHRTQIVVDGDRFGLSSGRFEPIASVEHYRRVVPAAHRGSVPFREQGIASRIAQCVLAAAIGALSGLVMTVVHQASLSAFGATVPWGIATALVVVAALLAGLRLAFETRIVAAAAALGLFAVIAVLSLQSSGGSVLVPANTAGYAWTFGPPLIALLVLAWPRVGRRSTGRMASTQAAKGATPQ